MKTLARALARPAGGVTNPFGLPIDPGPGHIIAVLASPGVGKSTLALIWGIHLAEQGYPVLDISLDTDLTSQAIRTVSILRDLTTDEVRADIDTHVSWLADQGYPLRMSDVPMQAEEIDALLTAETEFLGMPPVFTILDVVRDIVREGGYEPFMEAFGALHRVARKHKTTILALHHATSEPDKPVTMEKGEYKAAQKQCEIVLGMWRQGNERVRVSVLKNRMGWADPSGGRSYGLPIDLSRSYIGREL